MVLGLSEEWKLYHDLYYFLIELPRILNYYESNKNGRIIFSISGNNFHKLLLFFIL